MAIYLTRRNSLILGVGTILLFFASGIFMLALNSKKNLVEPLQPEVAQNDATVAPNSEPPAPVVLDNFQRNQIRDGKKLWEVLAERGRYLPGSSKAELEKAQLFLFRKDGSKVELTAERALLNFGGVDLDRADVSGDVRMVYNDKVQMQTENATYNKAESTVHVPGKVKITTETLQVTGTDLMVDIEKQEMQLRSDVTTVIQPRRKAG